MATHDYNIANQGFPAFRSDLNNVLTAINTTNISSTRPTSAVAGTIWVDNSSDPTWEVYIFDGTDDISIAQIDTTGNTSSSAGGGISWQTVKTASFNASASEGYFVNTTSGAITATLPSSPTLGDEIAFIDYAGTFDTNNLTIGRNGKPIQGDASDLTVATERAGLTLVFVDDTQGWLLREK